MTKTQIGKFRQQLLDLGRELRRDVGTLTDEVFCDTAKASSGDLSHITVDFPTDRDSGTYDEEVSIGLLEQEGPRQGEIKAALGRIDKGTFGRCETCGQAIAHDRLEVIPFARKCFACGKITQHKKSPVAT